MPSFEGRGNLAAMKNAVEVTVDSEGQLVLPRSVREEAGLLPGRTFRISIEDGRIELEPVPRELRIVQKGPLRVAVPAQEGPMLKESTVQQLLRELRD